MGKGTFIPSLDCVRPFGIMVNYGNASAILRPSISCNSPEGRPLSVCRPGLSDYLTTRRRGGSRRLFELLDRGRGILSIEIGRTYPLRVLPRPIAMSRAGRWPRSLLLLP